MSSKGAASTLVLLICICICASHAHALSFLSENTVWGIFNPRHPSKPNAYSPPHNVVVVRSEPHVSEYFLCTSDGTNKFTLKSLDSFCQLTEYDQKHSYKILTTISSISATTCRFELEYPTPAPFSTTITLHQSESSPPIDSFMVFSSTSENGLSVQPYSSSLRPSGAGDRLLNSDDLTIEISGTLPPTVSSSGSFAPYLLSSPIDLTRQKQTTTFLDFLTDCVTDDGEIIFSTKKPAKSPRTTASAEDPVWDFTNPWKYITEPALDSPSSSQAGATHLDTYAKSSALSSTPTTTTITFASRAHSSFRCFANVRWSATIPISHLWSAFLLTPVPELDNSSSTAGTVGAVTDRATPQLDSPSPSASILFAFNQFQSRHLDTQPSKTRDIPSQTDSNASHPTLSSAQSFAPAAATEGLVMIEPNGAFNVTYRLDAPIAGFHLEISASETVTRDVYFRQSTKYNYVYTITYSATPGCTITPVPDTKDALGNFLNYTISTDISQSNPVLCSITCITTYNTLPSSEYIEGTTSVEDMPYILPYFSGILIPAPAVSTSWTLATVDRATDNPDGLITGAFSFRVFGQIAFDIEIQNLWRANVPVSDPITLTCTDYYGNPVIVDVTSSTTSTQPMLDVKPRLDPPSDTFVVPLYYTCPYFTIENKYYPKSTSIDADLVIFVRLSLLFGTVLTKHQPWELSGAIAGAVNGGQSFAAATVIPLTLIFSGNLADDVSVNADFEAAPIKSVTNCVNRDGQSIQTVFAFSELIFTSTPTLAADGASFVHNITCEATAAGKPTGSLSNVMTVTLAIGNANTASTSITNGEFIYNGSAIKFQKLTFNVKTYMSSIQLNALRMLYYTILGEVLAAKDAAAMTMSDTRTTSPDFAPHTSTNQAQPLHLFRPAAVTPLLGNFYISKQELKTHSLDITIAVIQDDITVQDLNRARYPFSEYMTARAWYVIPQAAYQDWQDVSCLSSGCGSQCFQCDVGGACLNNADCNSNACSGSVCADAKGVATNGAASAMSLCGYVVVGCIMTVIALFVY